MKIECPDCKEKVDNMWAHVCRSGKSYGGGTNAHKADRQATAATGNKPAGEPAAAVASSPPEAKRPFRRPLASQREQTISYQKPWEAEGMSRRTWYRRQKEQSGGNQNGSRDAGA